MKRYKKSIVYVFSLLLSAHCVQSSFLTDHIKSNPVDMSDFYRPQFDGDQYCRSYKGLEIDKWVFQNACHKFYQAIINEEYELAEELLSIIDIFDLASDKPRDYAQMYRDGTFYTLKPCKQGGFVQKVCNSDYIKKNIPPLLYYAAQYHKSSFCMQLLLRNGADPNIICNTNRTSLDYADRPSKIILLLEHGAKAYSPAMIDKLVNSGIIPRINKQALQDKKLTLQPINIIQEDYNFCTIN